MPSKLIAVLLTMAGVLLSGCSTGPGVETATPAPIQDLAKVDSLEVLYLNTMPVEVQVVARGNLPDGCTLIDSVEVEKEGETFTAIMYTSRPAEAICTQVLVPFERVIPLDVEGLPAGIYAVAVNDAATTFEFTTDNVLPTEPPPDPATSSVRGFIWHDLCGTADAEGVDASTVTDGCVMGEDDRFRADGVQDSNEPPLEGVEISLGEGSCPQFPSVRSVSDEDGEFSFSGLQAGAYCLFVDPLISPNRSLLMPGDWTFPSAGVGFYDLELEITEAAEDLGFGWDFERLPPVNFSDCIDNAQFVRDVTIDDGTILRPGEVFTKTWLLRNTGTCHWVEGYNFVYAAGDRMSGENQALPTVLAGQETEVSVRMLAPDVEGEFRGDWQLENPAAERFGTTGEIDLTFFVAIAVEAAEIDPSAILGRVWADACDPELGLAEGSGCVQGQNDLLIANGAFDEGELGIEEVWVNLYTGSCASRGDSIDSSVTDVDGNYIFEGLEAGIYCVAVDDLATENIPILGTGIWTHPALEVSSINVTLIVDEIREEIDFGWYIQEE